MTLIYQLPEGIDKVARLIVGSSIKAAILVAEGKFKKAISIGGGLLYSAQDLSGRLGKTKVKDFTVNIPFAPRSIIHNNCSF